MLYLGSLSQSKKLENINELKKLLIVRKPPEKIPNGFIHVPQLSPSLDLFFRTKNWKKGNFKEHELFILENKFPDLKDEDKWWQLYKEEFEKEMLNRLDMVKSLKRLEFLLNNKEDIYLFCYCPNPERCHRGLIGKYLEEKGYEVKYLQNDNEQLSLF